MLAHEFFTAGLPGKPYFWQCANLLKIKSVCRKISLYIFLVFCQLFICTPWQHFNKSLFYLCPSSLFLQVKTEVEKGVRGWNVGEIERHETTTSQNYEYLFLYQYKNIRTKPSWIHWLLHIYKTILQVISEHLKCHQSFWISPTHGYFVLQSFLKNYCSLKYTLGKLF